MATLPMMHEGCSSTMVDSLISRPVSWVGWVVEYTNDVHVNLAVISYMLIFHGKVLACTSRCPQLI